MPVVDAGAGTVDDPGDAQAALLRAVGGEPPALRVRLADRSLRRTTPILAVTARLLELAASRVTASEVLDLADAMRKNPKLKVFSANGLFDLATPFFLTEFDLNHMMVTPELQKNVEFGYYPAGHMVYLNVEALKDFKHDLAGFYAETGH